MGEKDLTEKSLEFYPDVFADVVNALLYQGEQVLMAETLQSAPTETLYPGKQGILRNQFHDVSKYVIHEGIIQAQYVLENETKINRKIVLRKAGYEGAVYREQYDGEQVYPFIGLVLYWGKYRWKTPRSLMQLFGRNDVIEKNLSYIDNIKAHVYEMSHLPKKVRNRFHSDMRIIVDYLAEGENYVPSKQEIVHLEAVLRMLRALTGDARFEEIIGDLHDEEKEKGGVTMCELLDKHEKCGENRMAKLSKKLIKKNRIADLLRASEDEAYREQLFREFGIASKLRT